LGVADITDIQESMIWSGGQTFKQNTQQSYSRVLALFYLSAVLNSHTLCLHADITELYLEDLLDPATIILSPSSFLKTHASSIPIYSFTLLLYLLI